MGENIRIHVLTSNPQAKIFVMLSDPTYASDSNFEDLIQNTLTAASFRGMKITIKNRSALTPHYVVSVKNYGYRTTRSEIVRMLEQSVMRDAAQKGYTLHSVSTATGSGMDQRQIFLTN